jgi:hypothetical protein
MRKKLSILLFAFAFAVAFAVAFDAVGTKQNAQYEPGIPMDVVTAQYEPGIPMGKSSLV